MGAVSGMRYCDMCGTAELPAQHRQRNGVFLGGPLSWPRRWCGQQLFDLLQREEHTNQTGEGHVSNPLALKKKKIALLDSFHVRNSA